MSALVVRFLRTLKCLALLLFLVSWSTAAAWAQPAIEAFEAALDSFEYERALKLAQQMPTGPTRTLLLAEQALTSGRAELSFPLTDGLARDSIPAPLLAKLFLIQALQERALQPEYQALDSVAKRRVDSLVTEGLRQPELRGRDQAVLLLVRVRLGDIEKALKANASIAEIPDVDPRFALTGEAEMAVREQQKPRAATLWKALSDAARANGETRAARLYLLKHLALRPRSERIVAATREVFEASLRDKDAVVGFEATWLLGLVDQGSGKAVLRDAVRRMPPSFKKLEMISQALVQTNSKAEEIQLILLGRDIAHELKEETLEGYFWHHLARREKDPAKALIARSSADKLLLKAELRGLRGNVWLTFMPGFVEELRTGGKALRKPPGNEAQVRLAQLGDELSQALRQGELSAAEQSLQAFLSQLGQMVPADRGLALRSLQGSLSSNTGAYPQQPGQQLAVRPLVAKALLSKMEANPEAMELILDSCLLDLRAQPQWPRARRSALVNWLTIFGRHEEALEVNESQGRSFGLKGVDREKVSLLLATEPEKAFAALDAEGLGKDRLRFAWAALEQGKFELAESLVKQELASKPPDERDWLRQSQAYALQAFAASGQGRVDEALTILNQGEAEETMAKEIDARYRLPRAEILLKARRWDEAEAVLTQLPVPAAASLAFYHLRLRRDLAKGRGQGEEAARLQQSMLDLYARTVKEGSEPAVAHFALGSIAGSIEVPVPPLAPQLKPPTSFSRVSERIERLRRREPENEALRNISAVALKRLSEMLEPGELVVQATLMEDSVLFLCLEQGRQEVIEVFCDVPEVQKQVEALLQRLASPNTTPASLEAPRDFLSTWLVKPWRSQFPAATRIRWMGAGELGKLPLPYLREPDGGKEIIESLHLEYLDGPERQPLKVEPNAVTLLIGGADDLQGAARELEIIRKLFPSGQRWSLGSPLTELSSLLQQSRIVHIATHGVSPSGTRVGAVMQGTQGELSAFDLSQMSITSGTLAVVGTCGSAIDGDTGHDNSSLISALRTAGADVVIGSRWDLDDDATGELFEVFYRRLKAGASPESALAEAQRALRKAHPHPFYWAGLQVVTGP